MKRLTFSIIALFLVFAPVWGEVVTLHSGQVIRGQVQVCNDEIVLVRDSEGRRFQFLRSAVSSIEEDSMPVDTVVTVVAVEGKSKAALRLDMSGGALFVPSVNNGGYGAIDLQIGTRQIGNRHIFIGGSVGYHAAVLPHQLNNFLPLAVVVSVPLIEQRHAPELGAAIGYAFALKQPVQGGMMAKVDLSWRYNYSESSALLLGVQARFQQAQMEVVEEVNGQEYTSSLGRNMVSLGLRLALIF
ncbi:MAG: hypothetical protein MJZ75_03055 [Paludibacteraceae bacterium]|nr:hypothetical protein [Paludibacteraceae bacterium]